MTQHAYQWDAIVIGGGFYGSVIASYLAEARGLRRVLLLEREPRLLQRASYNNQARVHQGYHYPRDLITAYRSRINLPRFLSDWAEAIDTSFTKLYAIPRSRSHITARQFERFCQDVGIHLSPARKSEVLLFNPRTIENVYVAEEYAFDSNKLYTQALSCLEKANVTIQTNRTVTGLNRTSSGCIRVTLSSSSRHNCLGPSSRFIFNCTYSGLNQLRGDFPGTRTKLKHQATEMAYIEPPKPLQGLGITVMDGPFFSMMPFPAAKTYTLSHVRYTPHREWLDTPGLNPYQHLPQAQNTRFERMVRDAARYVPSIAASSYQGSVFEIKTVLANRKLNDGRPILFEKHSALPGCYSILGGKIDNIYDILKRLDDETFDPAT